MTKIPHIALLIETSREYGRGLLRGVARYHQEHGPWSIYFEPHGLNDRPPYWLKHWKGDGILARIDDRRMADAILATRLPAVDVRGALEDLPIPFVGLDNRPIAKLCFEHLQQCGLVNFAFCGTPRGMKTRIRTAAATCSWSWWQPPAKIARSSWVGRGGAAPSSWEIEQQQIARWLKGLRKPVGVMTCHDDRGHQTLDACRRAGLRVPDDVAVIGVDNDTHLCNMCTPPLTSVDVNPSHIGYEAAALLMRLMRGASKPAGPYCSAHRVASCPANRPTC